MFLGISDPVSEIPHRGRVSHPKTQDVQNWEALVDPKVDLPPMKSPVIRKNMEKLMRNHGMLCFLAVRQTPVSFGFPVGGFRWLVDRCVAFSGVKDT